MRSLLVLALALPLGCGDDAPIDSDAAIQCATDSDCDDTLFCNGVERCDPSAPFASALGCVAGTPCLTLCDERMSLCTDSCADADGDGFMDIACGGSDCDDTDADRSPGATEICNAVDEDCDPDTVGDLDADGDGFVSAECCNGAACGRDCDDSNASAQPAEAESCDGFDNDCDGSVDEGVLVESWPDLDGDRYGDAAATPERVCDRPSDAASRGGDCDDANVLVNPGVLDSCNDTDDDCDGSVDENGDALCAADLGVDTVGRCVVHPETGVSSCRGIDCAGGGIVCGGTQNQCNANACTSVDHCGYCGRSCGSFTCSDAQCSLNAEDFAPIGTVLDALTRAPIGGATIAARAECTTPREVTANADGSYSGAIGPFGELEIRAADHLPAVRPIGRPASATDTDLLLRNADLATILADPDVAAIVDPELGIVLSSTANAANIELFGPHGTTLHVDDSGDASPYTGQSGGLILILNVLPGTWRVSIVADPLCMSDCDTDALVVGGATTFVDFTGFCALFCA